MENIVNTPRVWTNANYVQDSSKLINFVHKL